MFLSRIAPAQLSMSWRIWISSAVLLLFLAMVFASCCHVRPPPLHDHCYAKSKLENLQFLYASRGFRSRREQCREPTPFTSYYASFAPHKAYLNSCIRGYVRTVTLDFLVSSFVTLLTVVDPVSLAPIF